MWGRINFRQTILAVWSQALGFVGTHHTSNGFQRIGCAQPEHATRFLRRNTATRRIAVVPLPPPVRERPSLHASPSDSRRPPTRPTAEVRPYRPRISSFGRAAQAPSRQGPTNSPTARSPGRQKFPCSLCPMLQLDASEYLCMYGARNPAALCLGCERRPTPASILECWRCNGPSQLAVVCDVMGIRALALLPRCVTFQPCRLGEARPPLGAAARQANPAIRTCFGHRVRLAPYCPSLICFPDPRLTASCDATSHWQRALERACCTHIHTDCTCWAGCSCEAAGCRLPSYQEALGRVGGAWGAHEARQPPGTPARASRIPRCAASH
jgi:hypothetical protein